MVTCILAAGLIALSAQSAPRPAPLEIRAHVLRASGTTVAGRWVVVHRVGPDGQGPLDSLRTDASGTARFSVARDSLAIHILTVLHDGIQYFSDPVASVDLPSPLELDIVVHDTSSVVPIRLLGRYVVIAAPDAAGTRTVVELLSLFNGSDQTRVAVDGQPSWRMPVPETAVDVHVDVAELSAEAVEVRAGEIAIFAPLTPGERQLTLQYRLPPDAAELESILTDSVEIINVLLEAGDPGTINSSWLLAADSAVVIDGRPFTRYAGAGAPGQTLRVDFPVPLRLGRGPLAALIALVSLTLAGAAWGIGRRRRDSDPGIAALVDELARLPAGERASQEALEDRLRQALADRRPPA